MMIGVENMSDEKIEAMFQLIHEENKAIMVTLLSHTCYPKDYEKEANDVIHNWDDLMMKVMRMK